MGFLFAKKRSFMNGGGSVDASFLHHIDAGCQSFSRLTQLTMPLAARCINSYYIIQYKYRKDE